MVTTWWPLADHLMTTCNVCLERVETLCIGNIYIRLYQYCWQLFWKFLKETLIHPQSSHTLTDKSKKRSHAGQTLNFLMSVCLIVWKCSFSSTKTQHACTNANVYDCFTMQSVLWPNAPINGGLAVLFTAWKYIFFAEQMNFPGLRLGGVGSAFHRMKIHIFIVFLRMALVQIEYNKL